MTSRKSVRIAVNIKAWKPSREEWLLVNQCVDREEKDRIAKFVFQRDAKASMVGQLLIRKVLADLTAHPFKDFELTRTDKGKPVLKNKAGDFEGSFNVAHHGHYTVIAADSVNLLGTDVMTFDCRKDTDKFLSTMRRQLTETEWSRVQNEPGDKPRMSMFYRLWCLKESYVKAIGTGIGFEVARLNFCVSTNHLSTSTITTDTMVEVDGEQQTDWLFEETLLDSDHCVAVATHFKNQESNKNPVSIPFQFLDVQELLSQCDVLPGNTPDEDNWVSFSSKEEMPQARR